MQLPPPGGKPGGGSGTPKPPRTKRRRRWIWRAVLALFLAWIIFLVAVPLWAWSKIDKVDASPSGSRPADQPGTTYLLVGSDSRKGLDAQQRKQLHTGKASGQRTDTIMLLHTGSGPSLLMSIPRDSLVPIPGHGTTKINAAFAYGGPKLLVKTIEQDTGIRVDDYIEVGFGGFVNVVDAVGGVQICPHGPVQDRRAGLHITRSELDSHGCLHAGGITALGYARSRHAFALSDIARIEHQRQVVSAIAAKAASWRSLVDPVRYFNLTDAAVSSLTVGDNVGPLDLARFVWAIAHVTGGSGLNCSVPISDLAVHWDPTRSKQLFNYIKQDRTKDIPKGLCTKTGISGHG
ncbi:MAG: LCP family protein [Nocardioidaceae bacterium]